MARTSTHLLTKWLLGTGLLLLSPRTVWAAPSADVGLELGAESDASARDVSHDEGRWIDRWPPTRNMVEIGVFGGLALPSVRLELFEPDLRLPAQGFKALRGVSPEFGARVAFFPLRFLGAELEGAVIPARTRTDRDRATLWALRGHVIGQLPLWSVTPFVLAGPSVLGVRSRRSALG